MANKLVTLSELIPDKNITEDASGDLLAFLDDVLQPVLDDKIQEINDFLNTFDPDKATNNFVNAILLDLGNPFDLDDLTLTQKRKLVRIIIDIYREKGTEEGIENAVRFLTGIDVNIVSPSISDAWVLGVDILDPDAGIIGAILGPSASFALYSFDVETTTAIPAELQDAVTQIVLFMKPAQTHFVSFIVTGAPVTEDEWLLDVSLLDVDTVFGPGDQSIP